MDAQRPASNEDKAAWIAYGQIAEREFCTWAATIGLDARLNPAKQADPYAFDLLLDGQPADLKTVRTPFYSSQVLYGISPQYAVTFNLKDAERYRAIYPDIRVVFDVRFTRWHIQSPLAVEPMRLVAVGTLDEIAAAVKARGSQKHEYAARTDDRNGNAKASWLFDVRDIPLRWLEFETDRSGQKPG
jgi:hypothetical protein